MNRAGNAHTTGVRLSLPVNSAYRLTVNGVLVPLRPTGNPGYPLRADASINSAKAKIDLIRDR